MRAALKVGPVALVCALVAMALFAVGCGSSDDDGTTESSDSPSSLTKAEFVKQGNEICTEGNEEIESGLNEFAEENGLSGNDQPTDEQIEELASEILIPSIAKQVGKLGDLGAPSGDEQKFEAALANAESTVEEVEADPSCSPMKTGARSSRSTRN